MNFRALLLGTAAAAAFAAPAFAQDNQSVEQRLDRMEKRIEAQDEQIRTQQSEIRALRHGRKGAAVTASDASYAEATAPPPPAQQPEVTAAQFEALQNQVYEQQAATTSVAKNGWFNNTSISGRMYFDLSNVDAKTSGVSNPQEGLHFDVKRFYVSIDHQFDDIFSADVTTDFTYDTSQCNGITTTTDPVTGQILTVACSSSGSSASQVYIKKAYLQAKLAPWAIFRAGSADMPWIPFAEEMYGYRYVENTLVDRFKMGNSADWGAFFLGSVGDEFKFEYSIAAVNGAGYKKPAFGLGTNRSDGMDLEGRADIRYDDFVLAVGGYTGKLGKELTPDTTTNTASRFDALAAYVGNGFHVGIEYFEQHNWNAVTLPISDNGDGWSGFAAWQFDPQWAVFGRYDMTKPEKTLLPGYTNRYYNIGIEYTPTKIVNIALVYKHDEGKNGIFTDQNGPIGGVLPDASGHYNEIGVFGQMRW